MNKAEHHNNNLLSITVSEESQNYNVIWTGKSIDRKPSVFITPILISVLKRSIDNDKRMVLDFCGIEYMNSSTITPIIKILERAKRSKVAVTVKYLGELKWQNLIFSALEIFQTKDRRIEIQGN